MLRTYKLAFFLYAIAILMLLGFGVMYLLRTEFMPYHAVALGQPWQELSPQLQVLLLALIRVAGAGMLGGGTAMAILLLGPFRRKERWASIALAAIALILTLPSIWATLSVAAATPASPPWQAPTAGAVLSLFAFFLALIPEKQDRPA